MNTMYKSFFLAALILLSSLNLSAQTNVGKIHRVKYGDTLFGIAKKYKLSLRELRSLNPSIKGDRIYPNDEVVVSLSGESSDTDYIATSGLPRRSSSYEWEDGHMDSLRPKSKRRELIFNKNESDPTASKLISDAFQDETTIHTILPGEDIYIIARLYHTSPKKILEKNPGKKIEPGTQLVIPLTKGTDLIALSDDVKVRKLEARHARLSNNPNLLSERGKYELIRRDREKAIYYVFHPSFPIGQKIYIQIPNNPGYIEASVIGRLPTASNAMIGISPRIYEIVKAADNSNMMTIYFEPK